MRARPIWCDKVSAGWERARTRKNAKAALATGIAGLARVASRVPGAKAALPEQPFDRHLLSASSLYRRSRALFLGRGGSFRATLVTSPRSLSSPGLLDPGIEYSPIETELVWAATDPRQSTHPERLQRLRTYTSSLFHEQNHRILWTVLPPPPRSGAALGRFLNLAESLVIVADMALGDELGPGLASLFHQIGVTYDPGTTVRNEIASSRIYRNYLQAALHATYLYLEHYRPKDIHAVVRSLFSTLGPLADRATRRSLNLDRAFVAKTNPVWQARFQKVAAQRLARSDRAPLALPSDPLDNRLQYLAAETWFDLLRI